MHEMLQLPLRPRRHFVLPPLPLLILQDPNSAVSSTPKLIVKAEIRSWGKGGGGVEGGARGSRGRGVIKKETHLDLTLLPARRLEIATPDPRRDFPPKLPALPLVLRIYWLDL